MEARSPSSNYEAAEQPEIVMPVPDSVVELGRFRRGELADIGDRLGELPRMPWGRLWETAAAVLIGGAVGGGLAGWQLNPDADQTAYWVVVSAVFVVGCLCVLAAVSTHAQRADSVEGIKRSLDKLLARYPSGPD